MMLRVPSCRPKRRGTILVVVMVVTVLAAMVAASLVFRMHAEVAASASSLQSEQAYAAAIGGLDKAVAILAKSADDMETWYDNEDMFLNQYVCDDGANRWYFTIYAYDPSDPDEVRYGLTDLAGKLNINTASEEELLRLPNMTPELVQCLLDYRDQDDDSRPQGAEQDYYDQLDPAYLIKNGPLATVEEALLIKSFNASIVFGEDANLNGLLDPNENDGDETFPPDNRDGVLDRGLKGLCTVVTYEPNTGSAGRAKININDDVADLSQALLGSQTEQFIQMYRADAEENMFSDASQLLEMRYSLQRDAAGGGSARGHGGSVMRAGTWIESGVNANNLAAVMGKLATQPAQAMRFGLVNVNTAGAEVLALVPGIDADLAGRIIDARDELETETRATVAWLYTTGLVDAEKFKEIASRLTTRSFQFHVKCVGFGWPSGRYRVIEAIVDLAGSQPRVTYLREITRLGLPFAIDIDEELGS